MQRAISYVLCLGLLQQAFAAPPTALDQKTKRFDYHSVRGRQPTTGAGGILEGEHLRLNRGSRVQGMRGYGRQWSGDAHLLWDGRVGDSMRTHFSVDQAGKYTLYMRRTKAVDYGVFSLTMNGQVVRRNIDFFSRKVVLAAEEKVGTFTFKAGKQTVEFKLTGANKRAVKFRKRGYLLGLDYIRLVHHLPPSKPVAKARTKIAISWASVSQLLQRHCHKCHGNEKPAGKVNLIRLKRQRDFLANIKVTQRVLQALSARTMPPPQAIKAGSIPKLVTNDREKLTRAIQSVMDTYLQTRRPLTPVVMRRLNRYEYNNAVRDLLQLQGDIYPLPERVIRSSNNYYQPASGRFPPVVVVGNRTLGKNQVERQILTGVVPFAIDLQAEHGFNNRGSELSLSPILMETFVKLAHAIVHSPEFDEYCRLTPTLFRAPPDLTRAKQRTLASQRLKSLLNRAFRAPADATTLQRYAHYFDLQLARTNSFSAAMKQVVAAVLASPRFLYLMEGKQQRQRDEPVNDFELATRLSFFLWSSIPDKQLLHLASRGELRNPETLRRQIRRLLLHPRSKALAENFARQWLRLDQLITAVPDFDRFQVYYSRIGCEQWKFGLQTMVEPLLLFESILVEDRSIMLLVDSRYSYRSDELHNWYTKKRPFAGKGNRNRFNTNRQPFRRRVLETRREGGVVTTAAILTMTSASLRTSPIKRGSWVATVMFNRPPPPPPDQVPAIEDDDAKIESKGITLRQRLQQHQVNSSCKSCHAKIDPLGFALENFDAIGRWRDTYRRGLKIDASGVLFGQAKFQGVVSFKNAILDHPEWFTRAFCEHMLAYALGRELVLADKPAVDRIVRRSLATRGRISAVVEAIATSYPFLHKTNQQPAVRKTKSK